MKSSRKILLNVVILIVAVCMAGVACAESMGTAFTYQGRLTDANSPADGLYDFEFAIFDDATAGSQQGSTVDVNDVDVIDGYFTVELDFGSSMFTDDARWLQINVRPGGLEEHNTYFALIPRQEVTPAPYALYAENAAGLTLPYAGSADGDGSPVFSITNTGIGSAIKGTGQNGYGVQGESSAAGSSGVSGINNSASGCGVFGWSDNGTGVKGFTSGSGVAGLFQIAGMSNSNAALEGKTNGTGTGIYGWATAAGGTNYGVRGRTESAAGYAGYFEGRLYTSGNVGIGTASPGARLEVNGQVKVTGGSPGVGKVLTSDAGGLATWQTPSAAADSDWQLSGVDMYSLPSGNVGIGTTTPRGKLDVEGDGGNIYLDTGTAQIYIGDKTGDGDETLFTLDDDSGKFTFENGNVGIGTTTPGARLEVNGQVKVTGGSPGTGKVLTSDASGLATWQTLSIGGDSDWMISGNNMYAIPNGNVGIGIITPATKLDVAGGINTTASYDIGGQNGLSVSGTSSLSAGPGAGANNTGNYNTFSGYSAGANSTTGNCNTFSGYQAGYFNTTGHYNTFSGNQAGYFNKTGPYNTFSGDSAGYSNTGGFSNTFSGASAGYYNETGNYNTFLGYKAGYSNTTGSYNTFLGRSAGHYNTIGHRNVFIGHDAGYYESGSDKLYIDNSNTATPLIYGDFAGNLVEINGTLDVKGPIWQRGGVLHADYVFEPDYQLESIEEHAEFMWTNKHLTAIPGAKTDETGREIVEVGAHRKGIVEELEKAHIYIAQLHQRLERLEAKLAEVKDN